MASESGRGAAAMLVSDEATDRQIWMTAVGMPVLVFPLHLDVSFE